MTVPDQVHINQVRNALWCRPTSRASVMVGAGFSQNATKARLNASNLPTWREITQQICRRLYLSQDGARQRDALEEASATSGFLRLAQEYQAVFGRSALNDLIKNLVRDSDFRPGDMHRRLLSLPWCDVFSTNWDTLLESARISVTNRPYSVVRTTADLASSGPPRIIKLHGSFPSHYPFIVTEEDYRTYPRKFAPFVNTVQQAMMETVFLLIGFSGDDPNFLHWSGWVRDNMGSSAPMIYLAGWLDLSAHRRQVLVDRNVVPIDLAHHPKAATWPEHLRHQYAAEWILRTLELGSPYDIADWPIPSHREAVSIKTPLQPIDVPIFDEPKGEPSPTTSVGDIPVDEVRVVIRIWSHNRRLYSGWLALPQSVYHSVSWRLFSWEPHVLGALPRLGSTIERLEALRELLWRHEILLEAIPLALEERASGVLDAIDCQARTVDGVIGGPSVDWDELRTTWRAVALALVTSARQRFDRACFDRRIERLAPLMNDHVDVDHTIRHERILFALWESNLESMSELVDAWETEDSDPVWTMRKAAALVETHRSNDAHRLISQALAGIRQHRGDQRSLAGPSREGWALLMAEAFERKLGERSRARYDRRMTELAQFHCDGREELRFSTDRVAERTERRDAPDFDHGLQTYRIGFSGGGNQRLVGARRAVRLTEVAALPPVANRVKIAQDILAAAADELASSDPRLASVLILRICHNDSDPLLKRVLSRNRVAAMPIESVEAIAQNCAHIIDYILPRFGGETIERLRVAIEVLSRIAVRLSADQVGQTFDDALAFYHNEVLASHLWLAHPIGHLLQRTWVSLPKERRTDLVLRLLLSPIAGAPGFIPNASGHPLLDPGELLSADQPPPRTAENEERWTSLVALLVESLRSGGEARRRASIRICYTGLREWLTDPERSVIADALWHRNHTPSDSLPGGTDLGDWTFLFLFEPTPKLADARFRAKWITNNTLKGTGRSDQIESNTTVVPMSGRTAGVPSDLNSIFDQVGSAISQSNERGEHFEISDLEQGILVGLIERWCEANLPSSISGLESFTIRPIRIAVIGLCSILQELRLSSTLADRLYAKLTKLHEVGIPAYELIPGIVRSLPDRFVDLSQLMRVGIVSEDVEFNRSAVGGMAEWMASAKQLSDLRPPPGDLVQEVGLTIATRRSAVLEVALRLATWIFTEGSPSQKDSIRSLVLHGLNYLTEELRYEREQHDFTEDDIPTLRWRCAQLAIAMERDGLAKEHAIVAWLKMIRSDPLPEVRYVEQ